MFLIYLCVYFRAYKQIEDLRHPLKQSVDKYVLERSEEIGKCQLRFNDLKLKTNYYIQLTEHILKDLPLHKCYKLSVYVNSIQTIIYIVNNVIMGVIIYKVVFIWFDVLQNF